VGLYRWPRVGGGDFKWHRPGVVARFWRQGLRIAKFEASLGYVMKAVIKKKKKD
jgi:hypothetical protein